MQAARPQEPEPPASAKGVEPPVLTIRRLEPTPAVSGPRAESFDAAAELGASSGSPVERLMAVLAACPVGELPVRQAASAVAPSASEHRAASVAGRWAPLPDD